MTEQDSGIVFPRSHDGRRSTASTGRSVWADAVRGIDADLAARIDGERDWRRRYVERVVDVTTAATVSPEAALRVARDGLAALHGRMLFARNGVERSLAEVMGEVMGESGEAGDGSVVLGTRTITGEGARVGELVVPYRGQELRGDALLRQLDTWQSAGTVEPSCAQALRDVVAHPEWLDLGDRAFAVLGAASELGPLVPLLSWGAHVAAVDLPREAVQQRLLDAARQGAGRLDLPSREDGTTGADLLTETPTIARWLAGSADGRPLTVGSYAYADGARHVQVAVASDAVVAVLLGARDDVSYAELATPTDAYAVPADIVDAATRAWQQRGWRAPVQAPARVVSRGALFAPGYAVRVTRAGGEQVGIADVLVPQQGPNYTLAKRLQRWRALVAQADGVAVSANVAPATSTRSVTKNRLLAAAYAGAGRFGVEVFAPETSRVLMAALLVHDLRAPAKPEHPDDLFVQQAAHGGLWRVGYSPRSVLGLAAVLGLPRALRA